MPWGKTPSWSEAPNKRCRGGIEACAGCSRSDAVRSGARGWQNCNMLAERGANKSAPSRGCIATSKMRDQQAKLLVSCVLVLAVLSREEHCSEVQRLLHVVQGCRPWATCAATNRRPLPSRCCSARRWKGKRTHSVAMTSEEKQGR